MGGAKFAILLPDKGPEDARAVAERVRVDIGGMRIRAREVEDVRITASVGAA